MLTGFKASNWRWNRHVDIRDELARLDLSFEAETVEDRELLAHIRKVVSDAQFDGKRIFDIQITTVPRLSDEPNEQLTADRALHLANTRHNQHWTMRESAEIELFLRGFAEQQATIEELRSQLAQNELTGLAAEMAKVRAIVESSDSYVPQDIAAQCLLALKPLDEPGKPNTLIALVERAMETIAERDRTIEELRRELDNARSRRDDFEQEIDAKISNYSSTIDRLQKHIADGFVYQSPAPIILQGEEATNLAHGLVASLQRERDELRAALATTKEKLKMLESYDSRCSSFAPKKLMVRRCMLAPSHTGNHVNGTWEWL